jgi:hypothetical protein
VIGQMRTTHQAMGRLGYAGHMGHPGSASAPVRVVLSMTDVGLPQDVRKTNTLSAPAAPPLSGTGAVRTRGTSGTGVGRTMREQRRDNGSA